ncbi:histidinol-phosphatase HisJ family protein [Lactococcus kimchii]|uniref:histidinol-phosphatase HisJ family protein n=1 Tax=Lactococcus sp. S-13 TaxID=2507158 RepID=UPI00102391BE|nr:histidinol-phosphatase HisJ family protein [Lactococcus sp. S-13]RZI48223.1 histidinol-phosphatase HisJ family protein [Lactococcus sp. S-13]
MKKVDYHLHSYFSADSQENPRTHILEALKYGLDEICFTEHRDFYFPDMAFDLDVPAYFQELSALQAEFSGQIMVKIGLEIGLDLRFKQEIEDFVSNSAYDFVIGSVHEINDIEVYDDTSYYTNKSKKQAHLEYLEAVLACVQNFDCFNALGHLDYVARYGPYADKFIQFDEFSELIHQILQVLSDKNKALEVNTRLFQYPETQKFYQFLIETYKNCGGKWITLGTDSHLAKRDWISWTLAQNLIKSSGFTELALFSKMQVENIL